MNRGQASGAEREICLRSTIATSPANNSDPSERASPDLARQVYDLALANDAICDGATACVLKMG
jgi:hypothetical protein